MMKPLFAAAALAACVPFAASAEQVKPITVSIEFDHALLGSDAGAEKVIADIREQARTACTSRSSKYGHAPTVDRSCADDVMSKAAVKILQEREDMGLDTAPAFARVAIVKTADLGQR